MKISDEAIEVSKGLENVFSRRENFIVIGLTGRTGSGCSSVADILCKNKFSELHFPDVPVPPASHEDRKDRIVREWCEVHWRGFWKIQVSHLILLLATSEDCGRLLLERLLSELGGRDPAELIDVISINQKRCVETVNVLRNIRSAPSYVVNESVGYLFKQLPKYYSNVKKILNSLPEKSATRVFQEFGDNLRKSGRAMSDEIRPDRLYALPEVVFDVIELVRSNNQINNTGDSYNYFVVDAIRHPYEARYLRERISSFYMVAVTTTEEDRCHRLLDLDFRQGEIEALDDKEYPSESDDPPTGYGRFVTQDIQACLGSADVYVSNLGYGGNVNLTEVVRQVCRYVSLMQHPGLITPTSVERCMQIAFSAKVNSGCISRQVGAVVTDSFNSIKSVGWNDVPKGQVPCLFRNAKHALSGNTQEGTYSDYESGNDKFKKTLSRGVEKFKGASYKGKNVSYCFKSVYNEIKKDRNQVHTRSLHAEENAFLQIVKHGGQAIEGGNLYTTASPCELCAKKAYQLGIKNIYYIDPYPGISKEHILGAGVFKPSMHLFKGAIGKAYHDLFDPIMPYKDELNKMCPDIDERLGDMVREPDLFT